MVGFKLPAIDDNDEGWGPTTVPEQFASVPFMPFGKGDRLGRIADFGQQAGRQQYHQQGRYRDAAPGTAVFNFEKTEEDEAFELVDNKPVKKTAGQQQRRPQQQQGRGAWGQQGRGGQQGGGRGAAGAGGRFGQQGGRGGQQYRQPWRDQPRAQYSSSVEIRPEWQVLGDQIALSALHKLSTKASEPEDITSVGSLPIYDRAADRVTPKMPAKLKRASQRARAPTMLEDSIIRKLASEDAGNVFLSSAVLTAIMCAPRSVLPWDLIITRRDGKLFVDRRPGSSLEYLTNGETAPEPPTEDRENVNGMQKLSAESTGVNQAFREQVLAAGGAGQPLEDGATLPSELASAGHPPPGFRYRRWTLGDLDIVVRCEIDACLKVGDTVQNVAIHALNEFDPKWAGVDWRQKLENQRGAVLATELKNNANKIAKWTAAAIISEIDIIKLGYISRASWRDGSNHVLLGTQAVKPKDFATQMNLNMDNCWGIVRALLDLCHEKMEEDGKYLLLRDANKPQLRLYAIPAEVHIDAEEQPEEEGDGQGQEDEE